MEDPEGGSAGRQPQARETSGVGQMRWMPRDAAPGLVRDNGFDLPPLGIQATRRIGRGPLRHPISWVFLPLRPATEKPQRPIGGCRHTPIPSRDQGPRCATRGHGLTTPALSVRTTGMGLPVRTTEDPPAPWPVCGRRIPAQAPSPRTTPDASGGLRVSTGFPRALGRSAGPGPLAPCRPCHTRGNTRPF
jgi:hypothetical protein